MFNLKASLIAACFAVVSVSYVQAETVDLYLHTSEGGNLYTQSIMLKDSLENLGYQVNPVNLGSCHSMQDYRASSTNPGIFIYSDVTHNEQLVSNCDVGFDESTFVVPIYNRLNAFCSRANTSMDEVVAMLQNDEPMTVAAVTSAPPHLFTVLGETLGKKVVMVPYTGTSDSIKGLLGGDADTWFGGLTARVAKNKEMFCWGNSSNNDINDMVPFNQLFENYEYSDLNSYWFVTGHNIDDELAKKLNQDLTQIFDTDPEWQTYINEGFLTRNSEVAALSITEILKNIESWQEKK